MASYSELRIRFEPAPQGDRYVVHVAGPAGQAQGEFTLPASQLELENLALRLSRSRTTVRAINSPELGLARQFGATLFDSLFSGRVRDLYRDSLAVARKEGEGLRVTLALTSAPELMHVPWEYLYDDPAFLSISTLTPVVRYLDLPRSRPPLPVTQPLRILAMVSSPSDVVELDVGREQRNLEEALAGPIERGAVTIDWLERATLRELQRELRREGWHIFHYIGHGGFDASRGDGVLLLEDDSGRGRAVSGMELGTMLADEACLRLAVLNSCEGARSSSADPYAGVATSLIKREVPAVVAMQFEISDRAAIVFAGEFYSALADGYPVDLALAEARKAIFADENDVEWGTPVLYMRVADGRIFDVDSSGKPAAPSGAGTKPIEEAAPPPPLLPAAAEQAASPPPQAEVPEPRGAKEAQPPPAPPPPVPRRPAMPKRAVLIAGAVALAAIAAIIGIVVSRGGGRPAAASVPLTTTTTQLLKVRPIFQDAFSSRANGWDDAGHKRNGGHYANGAYRLYTRFRQGHFSDGGLPRKAASVFPSAPRDVSVEVVAKRLLGGDQDAGYGIACRAAASGASYYQFSIWRDHVAIAKVTPTRPFFTELKQSDLSAVRPNGENRLQAVCTTDDAGAARLVFSLNGQMVARATDRVSPLSTGTVGLVVATGGANAEAIEAEFDDFVVTRA